MPVYSELITFGLCYKADVNKGACCVPPTLCLLLVLVFYWKRIMKVLCAEYNDRKEVAIVPVGDDVLLRNNGDFYIPEFTREVSCVPQFVVKICKLGKSISERFAFRYYDEIGVGVRFYADTLEEELKCKELPMVMASSFDSSAAISGMKNIGNRNPRYEMLVNNESVFQGCMFDLPTSVDCLVSLAGDFHTLKIGDFMYCGNLFRYRGLRAGDCITVLLEGEKILAFGIK